jgi:putative FmdB family regulatory protein
MPLYEYECTQCGHRFELIQRFADPLADTCIACGSGPVHKLLSAPAVHFKGTGWYVTDYAKKGSGAAGKPDAGAKDDGTPSGSPAAATSGAAATESKPAPAGEAKPAESK